MRFAVDKTPMEKVSLRVFRTSPVIIAPVVYRHFVYLPPVLYNICLKQWRILVFWWKIQQKFLHALNYVRLKSEVNSVKNTTMSLWLIDGVY